MRQGGRGYRHSSTYSVYLYENGLRSIAPHTTFYIKDSKVETQLGGGRRGRLQVEFSPEVGRYLGRSGRKNKAPTLPEFPLFGQ